MTTTPQISHIPCRNCAVPLAQWGDTLRSKTLVCEHCGTVMDVRNDHQALYAFTHIQRADSHLRIGMQGEIRGVQFQVVGHLAYQSRDSQWMQFQLYSPTHGYAQLLDWQGDHIFLRKTYYLPDRNLWTLKQGDTFTAHDTPFQISGFHFAEIMDAEGHLTLSVKPRQRNKQCLAQQGNHYYLSIQQRDNVDYFMGHRLDTHPMQLFDA